MTITMKPSGRTWYGRRVYTVHIRAGAGNVVVRGLLARQAVLFVGQVCVGAVLQRIPFTLVEG